MAKFWQEQWRMKRVRLSVECFEWVSACVRACVMSADVGMQCLRMWILEHNHAILKLCSRVKIRKQKRGTDEGKNEQKGGKCFEKRCYKCEKQRRRYKKQNVMRCRVEFWQKKVEGYLWREGTKTVERRVNSMWIWWMDAQVSWKSFSSVRLFCSAVCIWFSRSYR